MTLRHSRVCWGTVVHRRYRPKTHELRYKVFSLLLDVDELECADRLSRVFSVNRPNLISVRESDHGEGKRAGLKGCILGKVEDEGITADRVTMLCYPRLLGYAFNPLTVYYCYRGMDELAAIVYEVNNTFGDRQFYVLKAEAKGASIAQTCGKEMYVSPFNAVDGHYEFHVSEPGETLAVGVNLRVNGAPVMKAYHTAATEPLTERGLLRALLSMPLMTFKVIAGIHFEALRLWLKGLKIMPRPQGTGLKHASPD